jgi:hypothetical protein
MKNKVEEVRYDTLYQFAFKSESRSDFVERLQLISASIVSELAERIHQEQPIFPFQIAKIIDKMNEEILCLVENINTAKIVEEQPEVMQPLLLRLIQVNHPKLYMDYAQYKAILPN